MPQTETQPPLRFTDLVAESLQDVEELFPWDLEELLAGNDPVLLLDVREPEEYRRMHIQGSINVPRGVLESACDYGYEETVPELVQARERTVVVVCRSGNRSALAAHTMKRMGYQDARSLKTGLRGWNDYELPLVDAAGQPVDIDEADDYFASRVRPEQLPPQA